jgi:hypothetical protein
VLVAGLLEIAAASQQAVIASPNRLTRRMARPRWVSALPRPGPIAGLAVDGGLVCGDGVFKPPCLLKGRAEVGQCAAIDRGVSIRRVFVFDDEDQARDEIFLRIVQMQRDVGIDVRMLDFQLIPEWLHGMIFEYVIFDEK